MELTKQSGEEQAAEVKKPGENHPEARDAEAPLRAQKKCNSSGQPEIKRAQANLLVKHGKPRRFAGRQSKEGSRRQAGLVPGSQAESCWEALHGKEQSGKGVSVVVVVNISMMADDYCWLKKVKAGVVRAVETCVISVHNQLIQSNM